MYGLYSHCLAVDIVTSTSASAIIPTMDKIINDFGIPYKLGTDNGRPFHSHDLSNFAKRMGFEHTRVTPYAPWANGTVKYFMRNLGKVLKALHINDHNWKMALQSFLHFYRATRHSIMGYLPISAVSIHQQTTQNSTAKIHNQLRPVSTQESLIKRPAPEIHGKMKADNKAYVKNANVTKCM